MLPFVAIRSYSRDDETYSISESRKKILRNLGAVSRHELDGVGVWVCDFHTKVFMFNPFMYYPSSGTKGLRETHSALNPQFGF
jgi:hypothetical protein